MKPIYPNLRKRSARSGTTSVEFALMMPIIFTLFLGAIEITRLNFIRQTAANASYEGARKAITPGSTVADAQAESLRLLRMLGVGNGANASILSDATSVTVTVTVPVNQNSWGISRFTSGINVTNTCKLTRETL